MADFNRVIFKKQSKNPHKDFKPLLLTLINELQSDYIMFATDDIIVKDTVSITECVKALQKTHAYGFHLRLGTNINHFYILNQPQKLPLLIDIEDNIYAWQTYTATDYWSDWAWINTLDMTLYPKNEIINALASCNYENPNTLENALANLLPSLKQKVCLCFKKSKTINIPLNRVQNVFNTNRSMDNGLTTDFLLKQFNAGFKIDIHPLHQCNNCSVHTEYNITFIKR